MKVQVYYEYQGEGLTPQWMVINFKRGSFDWSKNNAYIPLNMPFERMQPEDFIEDELGLAVTLVDLVMNSEKEGYFGIHIPSLKKRINQIRGDELSPQFMLADICRFVIQMGDLEELLAMDRNDLFAWR